jgi:hypothetical protein
MISNKIDKTNVVDFVMDCALHIALWAKTNDPTLRYIKSLITIDPVTKAHIIKYNDIIYRYLEKMYSV